MYHRAIIINSMVFAQKKTGELWIRIEDLDINPRIYSQLIFDKGAHDS
jgi:glutamyl/glutaminyl-tRNA synthetase